MDFNLDPLGSRNFEHLAQAVVARHIGPKLMIFGDGPDGGREATWRGEAPSFGSEVDWNGYGVLQAKFKSHPTDDPAKNLTWMKSAVKEELDEWARQGSKRHEKPDYLLFVTNVKLSAVPASGKDAIDAHIRTLLEDLALTIKSVRVLDYHDIAIQLASDESIRKSFAAFVTPGDVIASLLDESKDRKEAFGQALATYTAKSLLDENLLNLTQAGTAGDGQITIADVFIDLPANVPSQPWLDEDDTEIEIEGDPDEIDEDENLEFDFGTWEYRSGIAKHLINDFNHIPDARSQGKPSTHRTVLIGGPGQGKSTITQWLAQMYRAEFLRGSPTFEVSEISAVATQTEARRVKLGLPPIQARRWPIRLVLTDLADYLAKRPDHSLLHYMAHKISLRSSFEIDQLALRKWLASYPWVLLIDGLDEVPASSNREQVMTAIRDFFLDAAAVRGDVAAIATTRPQGYSEEFSPIDYQHINLSSLTVEEALAYAEGLVAGRLGQGTPRAEKVMDRLVRASKEEHTSRLFESPLQVTILEVLLEKLGKAPNDRSRLYSAYYNVISQREQEKSDALSDLLQKYEDDVDYLHRRIGFELQQRGSEVGETSSSLTKDEFDGFLVERFREQGHSDDEVGALLKSFTELVTDRLVFLAKLQTDRIGFELRSFQEFMAGEHIIALPEGDVVQAIERIAIAPYWRNVVIFAIGSIFSHREHLRAEIVLLCERLNDDPKVARVVLPGSELALDILRDGSCLSMPIYARSLGKHALRLMGIPRGTNTRALLVLRNTELAELLWQEAESLAPASTSEWINRVILLSALKAHHGDRADAALLALFESANNQLRAHLIEWTWATRDKNLADIIGMRFLQCPPSTFDIRPGSRRRPSTRKSDPSLPDWFKHLISLSEVVQYPDRLSDESPVRAFAQPLGAATETWKWLRGLDTEHQDWNALKALADFAIEPSAQSLAKALEEGSRVSDEDTPAIAPWPYFACLQYAKSQAEADPARMRADVLVELAAAARLGKLGDSDCWSAAQERWGDSVAIDEALVESTLHGPSTLPLWPELRSDGFAPFGFRYSVRNARVDAGRELIAGIVRAVSRSTRPSPVWIKLSTFLGGILARQEEELEQEVRAELFELIRASVMPNLPPMPWLGWLELVPMTDKTPDTGLLEEAGSQSLLSGAPLKRGNAEILLKRAKDGAGSLPLARIALKSRPTLLETVSIEWLSGLVEQAEPELIGGIIFARNLLAADEEAIWSGKHDVDFTGVLSASDTTFDAAWFALLLEARDSDQTLNLAARFAVLAADPMPAIAERFLGIAGKDGIGAVAQILD